MSNNFQKNKVNIIKIALLFAIPLLLFYSIFLNNNMLIIAKNTKSFSQNSIFLNYNTEFIEEVLNSIITIVVVVIILIVISIKQKNKPEEQQQQHESQSQSIKEDTIKPEKTNLKSQKTDTRCEYCNGIILKDDTVCEHCGAQIIDNYYSAKNKANRQ